MGQIYKSGSHYYYNKYGPDRYIRAMFINIAQIYKSGIYKSRSDILYLPIYANHADI